jgi:hypothetical protein
MPFLALKQTPYRTIIVGLHLSGVNLQSPSVFLISNKFFTKPFKLTKQCLKVHSSVTGALLMQSNFVC